MNSKNTYSTNPRAAPMIYLDVWISMGVKNKSTKEKLARANFRAFYLVHQEFPFVFISALPIHFFKNTLT